MKRRKLLFSLLLCFIIIMCSGCTNNQANQAPEHLCVKCGRPATSIFLGSADMMQKTGYPSKNAKKQRPMYILPIYVKPVRPRKWT